MYIRAREGRWAAAVGVAGSWATWRFSVRGVGDFVAALSEII